MMDKRDAVLPDACLRRLHRLAWCPGQWMSEAWWVRFDLGEWSSVYGRHPGCRAPLDALIAARRGFPAGPLPAQLSPISRSLLRIDTQRLPKLIAALGLVHGGNADWFLFTRWRQALEAAFTPSECDQLRFFCSIRRPPETSSTDWGPDLQPATVIGRARRIGYDWLDGHLHDDPAWRALEIVLPEPPVISQQDSGAWSNRALDWLFRLERFL